MRSPRSFLAARWTLALLAIALAVPVLAAGAASLHATSVTCTHSCAGPRTVYRGGTVLVRGSGFARGAVVVFQGRSGRHRTAVAGSTRRLSSTRLSARVPGSAVSGKVYVRNGRSRSNAVGPLTVRSRKRSGGGGGGGKTAFDRTGMWIWYVSQSSGGDPAAIVAQARAHHVGTVFIKSSDGASPWSQFSSALIGQLKAGGLRVCAWQYVYGNDPATEAALGAAAVRIGADCLVIDAESQYEGRYAQADAYMTALRQAIGRAFPVGLAGFPYVDYHPAFPYSVFLGPGGAQFNVPQIYWKAIGVSVDTAVNHTYRFNRPYGRAIDPLGQAYGGTSAREIHRFRQLISADGSHAASWWDWQEATPAEWQAIGDAAGGAGPPAPAKDMATLGSGARGDLVVWAQEHLGAAGQHVSIDGSFGSGTRQAVVAFQRAHGLSASGAIDTATWRALLRFTPPHYSWAGGKPVPLRSSSRRPSGPASALLPARHDEIPPAASRR